MSPHARANVTAVCVAIGAEVGVGLGVGNWIIGVIVGGTFDERMRHRRGLPARRALIEFGRKEIPRATERRQ
jgi:hypothetical protein